MIEKDRVHLSIQDNFLPEEEFVALRNIIFEYDFPWYFSPNQSPNQSLEGPPGMWYHKVFNYVGNDKSFMYKAFEPILEQLDVVILLRMVINTYHRLSEHYFSYYHSDTHEVMQQDMAAKWTSSILYLNTNNGYTEIESTGERIESVANRLVSYPSNTRHRVVTQTDTQRRIIVNFNYLKSHIGRLRSNA
jgi:hypothetical protein